MPSPRHPAMRIVQLGAGGMLIVGAGVIGPLPGPGGIFLFAGGMVLILRNSHWARLRWARLKRRWPKTGSLVDRVMRRRSAIRRAQRAKERADPDPTFVDLSGHRGYAQPRTRPSPGRPFCI